MTVGNKSIHSRRKMQAILLKEKRELHKEYNYTQERKKQYIYIYYFTLKTIK